MSFPTACKNCGERFIRIKRTTHFCEECRYKANKRNNPNPVPYYESHLLPEGVRIKHGKLTHKIIISL